MVWTNKNNKIAFIQIQDPSVLDGIPKVKEVESTALVPSQLDPVHLQYLKRQVNDVGMFQEIDWVQVELNSIMFQKKYEKVQSI